MVLFLSRTKKITLILSLSVFLAYIFPAISFALTPKEEILAKIEYIEKKRKVIKNALKEYKVVKKKYDKNKAETKKKQDEYNAANGKYKSFHREIENIKMERARTLQSYGPVRRTISRVIPTELPSLTRAGRLLKALSEQEYYRLIKRNLEKDREQLSDERFELSSSINELKDRVKAISPDPKKFMADSQDELDRLNKDLVKYMPDLEKRFRNIRDNSSRSEESDDKSLGYDLSGVGVSSDKNGADKTASGSMFDFWPGIKDEPLPKNDTGTDDMEDSSDKAPKFVGKIDKKGDKKPPPQKTPSTGPDKNTDTQEKQPPRFLKNIDKKPVPPEKNLDNTPPESSSRDDYRIVSVSVETEPVLYNGKTLNKLKSTDRAVIVIEMRGKQHIVEGMQAVSILVEKGLFYNFPGVGLVATSRYSNFGGYNKNYRNQDEKQEEPDECGRELSACYAKWGANMEKKQDFDKMSTENYWARVKCVQLHKRCKMRGQENKNFDDGFKRTPMSEHDAKIFGVGVLGK